MLRLNDTVAVPVARDEAWIGIVQALRLGDVSISSTTLSARLAWDVCVKVNGAWYILGDVMLMDPRTLELIQAVSTETGLAG